MTVTLDLIPWIVWLAGGTFQLLLLLFLWIWRTDRRLTALAARLRLDDDE